MKKIYILNENVSQIEYDGVVASCGGLETSRWPSSDAAVPADIYVAILIVRQDDTLLEHQRATALIASAIRIACLYLEEFDTISSIADMFCSAKVVAGSNSVIDAIHGDDGVQQNSSGDEAPKTKRKHHNCNK